MFLVTHLNVEHLFELNIYIFSNPEILYKVNSCKRDQLLFLYRSATENETNDTNFILLIYKTASQINIFVQISIVTKIFKHFVIPTTGTEKNDLPTLTLTLYTTYWRNESYSKRMEKLEYTTK